MHYLHPRSRTTGTLFTTTLAISFAVVALPHLLPCPVDRRQFADSYETPDGRIVRRRRKRTSDDIESPQEAVEATTMEDTRPKRECPVPKPGGLVGQIMGFKNEDRPKPVEVEVQRLESNRAKLPPNESKDGL